ncbi:holliday junction ATP-dependent DNA helicase RuvA [Clostridium homopropionicum DSM 5847]|uniref:Holliday junction branch migration complex subunit RuvA n=1 Tax=Clostridium homopropionicum DSM 5847 TaxID=1121318 RepID=A0A0L6ZDN1_9CLOT|nr:Holliday junction branch migration protein RuvA [Clostridium homopropionicum]KOA21089.1 holliday junction ATP-dependent DNA helicase RuvA [Clostridium homopropionicum DSM 5847]SFF97563.1 Holliday junction DNA helicase subunit RuvA [Clostridium homopropionicum]
MFEYIKGIYIGLSKDYIIVENNNIGYKIFTSGSTMAKMPNVNEEVKLYLEQVVREDFNGLYGFLTEEEREMFNLLMTINGVGRKAALSLLSISNVNKLKLSIVTSDYNMLMKAPGIGKKIAQRIILELADKVGKTREDNKDMNLNNEESNDSGNNYVEAMSALLALGFSEKEAEGALKSVDLKANLEIIIKNCLKHLMN